MTLPEGTSAGPAALRSAMADYVRAVHQAYLDAAALLPPGDRARLPLVAASELTVAAVGTRYLHVLATADPLPPPSGPEVEIPDAWEQLTWRLRFFDPVLVPSLGLIDETDAARPDRVREVLGIRTVVYHLSVPPGGGLSPHHAQHAGTGLAHSHAAATRDYETMRGLGLDPVLVDQMQGAEVASLPAAVLLLGRELAPSSPELTALAPVTAEPAVVRRAVLAHARGSRP